jgi:hypothetical protein
VNWKLILLCVGFSMGVWWIIDSTAPPKTAESGKDGAATGRSALFILRCFHFA